MNKVILINIFLCCVLLTGKAQIPEQAEDISPLLISEKIPSVNITALNGEKVLLTDIVKRKPSILLFYRGGWCPYCNAHLSAVGQVEQELLALGYQVLAISPDSPGKLKATLDKQKINYELYSDGSAELMQAMGLAFKAPDRYQDRLANYSDGQNHGLLPVPSLFVVDMDGTILFEYINPDYKHRIGADMLLAVLKQLDKKK
jgi:peroxiredoxin